MTVYAHSAHRLGGGSTGLPLGCDLEHHAPPLAGQQAGLRGAMPTGRFGGDFRSAPPIIHPHL